MIEVNPRVSRSSALASKATGYPIARVAAQIAAGRRLAEIPNVVTGTTVAAFEPALDYVVVKLPRFPFDKFPPADRSLGSQMKATGEVMAIDRTFGAALNKALRGLEQAGVGPLAEDPAWAPDAWPTWRPSTARLPDDDDCPGRGGRRPRTRPRSAGSTTPARPASRPATPSGPRRRSCCAGSSSPSDSRLWRILALLRRGVPEATIGAATGIALVVPGRVRPGGRRSRRRSPRPGARLVDPADGEAMRLLATVKRAGFGDRELAGLAGVEPGADPGSPPGGRARAGLRDGRHLRRRVRRRDALLLLDLRRRRLAARGAAGRPAGGPRDRLRPGPDRAGDRVRLLRRPGRRHAPPAGLERGDDQLEPGDGLDRLRRQQPALLRAARSGVGPQRDRSGDRGRASELLPAFVQFGGQTPLNLAAPLAAAGVPLLGADLEAIDQSEERTRFAALLDRLGIPQPEGGMAHSVEEALTLAERIGYPVIVRPSFVIGGLAIDFSYSPEDLVRQLAAATVVDPDRPVRIDRYLEGVEVDVDAISDGTDVLIPGLLEHVERAGVHSGDSVGVFPPQTVSEGDQGLIVATMERIVLALGVRGLVNAQFIVREDGVYLIEVNPRASRTVPVPVEGDRRADGRAGRPDRARARRSPSWAGRAACSTAAGLRRGQGAGLLDGQAARRRSVGRARDAVDRRGDRDPRDPAVALAKALSPPRSCRPGRPPTAPGRSPSCRSPIATRRSWPAGRRPSPGRASS